MSRLYKKLQEEIIPEQKKKNPKKCAMQLPVLKKVIISMGLGDALKDKKLDVRLRDKLTSEGKLNKDEVEKYLGQLDDESSNLTYTDQEEESSSEGSEAESPSSSSGEDNTILS